MPKLFKNIAKGLVAGGAGAVAYPSESEAMPRGVFQKTIKGTLRSMSSSSAKVLKGRKIGNRTIIDVRKSRGKFRKILFDDGTHQTVNKQDITNLVRSKMTKKYIQKFNDNDPKGKTEQAIKSLRYHEVRAQPFTNRDTLRRMHNDYLKQVKEMGDIEPNTSFVTRGNKYFQMPTEYAEHLQQLGIVRIMKGRRDLKALEVK